MLTSSARSLLINGLMSLSLAFVSWFVVPRWLALLESRRPQSKFAYEHWKAFRRYSHFRIGILKVSAVAFGLVGAGMLISAGLVSLGLV